MKKLVFIATLVAGFAFFNLAEAQVKSAPTDVIAQKVESTRGTSKYQRPTTDVEAPAPDKSRGYCYLNFDNWTGYFIDVWVGDMYRGRVEPYSEGHIAGTADGKVSWYAETAGGTYYWSGSVSCNDAYNLKLK